jgi:hypothetical protein
VVWTKLSDDFPENERITNLSDRAFRLHVAGLCYSNRQLTDGFVPRGQVPKLVSGNSSKALQELRTVKLWLPKPAGYAIVEFHEHQPSRADVIARRARITAARADAGRSGGIRSGELRRSKTPANGEANQQHTGHGAVADHQVLARHDGSPVPVPGPVPERNLERDGGCVDQVDARVLAAMAETATMMRFPSRPGGAASPIPMPGQRRQPW